MADFLSFKRNTYIKEINNNCVGKLYTLNGWIANIRDHGALIFVDLDDYTGVLQLVFDISISESSYKIAKSLTIGSVIALKGKLQQRSEETINKKLNLGFVELNVSELVLVNKSLPFPFPIFDKDIKTNEETLLRYRFLYLRNNKIRNNLLVRSEVNRYINEYLFQQGFVNLDTPILNKSTPEGARDFIVPSRMHKNAFYALPQSPQIFKQILMVSGFDKYFQIAKCFRDEDLRADRQPEFTQLDIEMSFVTPKDIMNLTENILKYVLHNISIKDSIKIDWDNNFKVITYDEAINKYGSDKPDLRFGLYITDLTSIVSSSNFSVFNSVIKKGGNVSAISLPNGCELMSRKYIDDLIKFACKNYGIGGLAWMKYSDGQLKSSITKFFSDDILGDIVKEMKLSHSDIVFFVADDKKKVLHSLGLLRIKLANDFEMFNRNTMNFTWIIDFPLFEKDSKTSRYKSVHHPFTSPKTSVLDKFMNNKIEYDKILSDSYDLVLNGNEIGGGSLRIYNKETQTKIFDILGLEPKVYNDRFKFLLEALQYGAPPHGGIALGLDRLLMIITNENSIRDVIPFPKTQKGACIMSGSPSYVDPTLLTDLFD